ncbi:MAG TPA: site-specific DNA-methyltransferase [Acidimicrobiales bacterium]
MAPRGTSTSTFGVGRRESHDSSEFYARFQAPEITTADAVAGPVRLRQRCILGDARHMDRLEDNSVALVVTSPPYFAGKEYEEALGHGHIPGSYKEYLMLLRDVFRECARALEPGGRIAVNVANLGRKPYRSLASDVIRILQDDLRLLLRGEVIWRNGEGSSGSCAWGSYRSAANPVLRDTTERIVVASKGRFDRAQAVATRQELALPHESTITSDEFMEATLDVWNIAPESARRVNHPAPFPVELPQRLIELYTYRGDLVLDPFMGSGTTLVAAVRAGREHVGYDTDPAYVETASKRVGAELRARAGNLRPVGPDGDVAGPSQEGPDDVQTRARREGKAAKEIAERVLTRAGFRIVATASRVRGLGLTVDVTALDGHDDPWYFDVTGAFTTTRAGLVRTDTLWRSLGRAHVLAGRGYRPLVLLTSQLPKSRSQGDRVLRAAGPAPFFDAMEMLSASDQDRLAAYAGGGRSLRPLEGFWTGKELAGI